MAVLIRTSRTATNNFRLNAEKWTGVPKTKSMYYIRFVRSNTSSTTTDWTKSIGVIAHTVTRPSVTFELTTLNQYNKKRLVQSKQEFEPFEVKFHDTVDQRAYNMFEDYYRNYYGEPNLSSASDWTWDVMASAINKLGNWGFRGTGENTAYTNYFSHIEVYYIFGGKYTRIDYMNPKFESINLDELDMSSGEGLNITLRIRHEGQVYQGNDKPLTADLIAEMGLNYADFEDFNPGSVSSSSPTLPYNTGNLGNSLMYDPLSALYPSGGSALPPSTSNSRSDALSGLDNAFNSVLNGLLGSSAGYANDGEDNYANRLTDGLY